ncbi:unnamed protein product, partial [marine sediment metagenome]
MKIDYHKYVFDNNKFVGKFEDMYQNEKTDYDSWLQSDLRDYGYQLSLAILNQYNFNKILDIGCGKGLFTSLLKKKNNEVVGIDVSLTAVKKAMRSYPDIDFQCFNVNRKYYIRIFEEYGKFDLIVCKEVLSYMKDWKKIVESLS